MTSLHLCRSICGHVTVRPLLLRAFCPLNSATPMGSFTRPDTQINLQHTSCLNHSKTMNQLVTTQLQTITINKLSTTTRKAGLADGKDLVDTEQHPTRGTVVFSATTGLLTTLRLTRRIFIALPCFLIMFVPFVLIEPNVTWDLKLQIMYQQTIPIALPFLHHLLFRAYASKVYYNEHTKKFTMLQCSFLLKEKVTEFTLDELERGPAAVGWLRMLPYPIANCRINGKLALIGETFFDYLDFKHHP